MIRAFLTDRCQRVFLNGKCSAWKLVTAGVPQGSVLGPLFFLIYINDLVDDLSSEAKLFADDTSLFTIVYDEAVAADQLNRDLSISSDWAYQWKMQFNPDKNKQAVQVIFSCKKYNPIHPSLFFNQSEVVSKDKHTHLGMILDSKLNFNSHVREAIIKARRGIGIIRYLSKYVSRDVLDQIYKLYVRPHLDYGDIIYHKYYPEYTLELTKKLESTQYSGALAVSGSWRGTNTDRLFEELGWEYLYHRRWYRRLCHFYKLRNTQSPDFLFQHIPSERVVNYNLRNPFVLKQSVGRTSRYSNTYFQNCIKEWNLLDIFVRNYPTLSQFKHNLIQIIRPPKRSTFGIHDVEGLKLLTRLRVKFSDLREHRFRHNFRCNSPNCLCGKGIEDNEHFLLHCHRYGSSRRAFLDRVSSSVNFDIKAFSSSDLCNLLLYGDPRLNLHINRFILESTLHFINQTKRFKKLLDEDPV